VFRQTSGLLSPDDANACCIRDILLIATPQDLPQFERLLGDGCQWALTSATPSSRGRRASRRLSVIGRDFLGRDNCILILGDNIFSATRYASTSPAPSSRQPGTISVIA
jgi:glucose-1-phosphate thymidylyltransferase